jgi:hypothetical protein
MPVIKGKITATRHRTTTKLLLLNLRRFAAAVKSKLKCLLIV